MSIQPLAPLRFPLHGSRLIEASAGTGKTYTIAALYLRLVLGHGAEGEGFNRPLQPPEILVVTFTDAATQELRDRIRDRLGEAAQVFRGLAQPDPLLQSLMHDYPAEQHPACARKLELAAQWMDEAAVYTIHSWCQRMLRQHAFDSGSLFTLALDAEDPALLAEAVRDYWRLNFYPRGPELLGALRGFASQPDELQQRLRGLLDAEPGSLYQGERALGDPRELDQLLTGWLSWQSRAAEAEHAARALWQTELDALLAELSQAVASKRLKNNIFKPATLESDLPALRQWAEGHAPLEPALAAKYASAKLLSATAAKAAPLQHPAFDALQAWAELLEEQPSVSAPLLAHAAGWVRARFDAEKQRLARMDFNDLLTRLDAALQRPGGARLAEAIRQQYPVALIDEFQDTDPTQYRIFDSIYRVETSDPATALILIGDPKQAIYSFRGADIHTYLRARRATGGTLAATPPVPDQRSPGNTPPPNVGTDTPPFEKGGPGGISARHYTLARNFRSTGPLVQAVNHLFLQGEAKPDGAFQFKREGDNPLPFLPVEAQGRKEQLQIDGAPQPALTLWYQAPQGEQEVVNAGLYQSAQAEAAASEITRLLNLAQQGRAGFARDGQLSPLAPADIAILVRGRGEAQRIREALAQRGIKSVYLSDRDSVFASPEAADLLHWLKACAEPERDRLLRAALATATLALSLDQLDRLNRDELHWEQQIERFAELRRLWRLQGVLPMLRHLLNDFDLPARLLAREEGERSLTNLLHLAELLAAASQTLDGEQALIRYLAEQIADSEREHKEHTIRLESDAGLVKVITIHKSKGLEYPLVFLPFICNFKPVDGKASHYRYHAEDGHTRIDLDGSPQARQQAERERLQEDLRLLYVALTRPRHACWLGLAPLAKGQAKQHQLAHTAIGHLLLNGDAPPQAQLQAVADGSEHIQLAPLPAPSDARYQPPASATALAPARAFHGRAAPRWWIASYSALKHEVGAADTPAADVLAEIADEPSQPTLAAPSEAQPGPGAMHRFPRGPQPGTFLHGLLEWAALEGFGEIAADHARRRATVAHRCQQRGWGAWTASVDAWLAQQLQLPMAMPDGSRAQLAALPRSAYQPELEFWLQTTSVNTQAVDRLVCQHIHPGQPRPQLSPNQLNGMLKGFIDLVFQHDGRYYVADYKSNWLGADARAYTQDAMTTAVLEKRYDLQYALYLLALHRLLKARLPGYHYPQHIGGAAYLFLRGLDAPSQGLYLDAPAAELIEALDALFKGERP